MKFLIAVAFVTTFVIALNALEIKSNGLKFQKGERIKQWKRSVEIAHDDDEDHENYEEEDLSDIDMEKRYSELFGKRNGLVYPSVKRYSEFLGKRRDGLLPLADKRYSEFFGKRSPPFIADKRYSEFLGKRSPPFIADKRYSEFLGRK